MLYSRTFTGAWIETHTHSRAQRTRGRRTFTGAWIETTVGMEDCYILEVAPSRVRGLKHL